MKPLVPFVTFAAGAMDAATGMMLVAAPATTLGLFGAMLPGGDGAAILMRWVGVFVLGVGLSYLWSIASRDAATRARRLPGVWGATMVIRTGVAVFCFTAVASRQLEATWLVVGATDAALAGLQGWALRAGWLQS
jgi:hypothetical protein